ncbi:MAG: hypothetical protein AAGG80_05570, partial [Pseudomonadota bacterium]
SSPAPLVPAISRAPSASPQRRARWPASAQINDLQRDALIAAGQFIDNQLQRRTQSKVAFARNRQTQQNAMH